MGRSEPEDTLLPAAGDTPAGWVGAPGAERAALPLEVVRALDIEHILGRSLKVLPGALFANRYLITLAKAALGPHADRRVLDLCGRLGMPDALRQEFAGRLPAASYVHVGFEETDTACIYKVYLEFWTNWENELEVKRRSQPFVGGYGFKWDAADPARSVTTTYTCYPRLLPDAMVDRVAAVCVTAPTPALIDIVRAMIDLGVGRAGYERVLYLEASEPGNPRRSFDINMLHARVTLAAMERAMQRIGEHFGIEAKTFAGAWQPARGDLFSHVAGGVDRQGRDFLTVYYGLEERRTSGG